MIIQRYLVREIILGFLATLSILLLIILGNTFVLLLGDVSGGSIPVDALGKLVLLQSVGGIIKLVPIALLIGMMFAFGRLYSDHEIAALHASGVGPKQFYKGIFLFVGPLTLLIAGLVLFATPAIERTSQDIKNEIKQRPEAAGIPVGEFMHANAGNKKITLFVENIDKDKVVMNRFFLHIEDKQENINETSGNNSENTNKDIINNEKIISAEKALLYIDPESGDRVFKVENGSSYDHDKISEEFTIFNFKEHGIHIPALTISTSNDLEAESFLNLLKNNDNESHAEIHWRIALILQAPIMALLAFPLSYTTPREGRFGKIAIGILLYAIYANLIITGQSFIEDGKIPHWLGLWWVHIAFILLALWLVQRRYGKQS
jgi:lipopolysaccharide export system permease protein